MKKLALLLTATVIAITLSGCDNYYPSVKIDEGIFSQCINIDIGSPYKYKGFDTAEVDGGKDLILHFVSRKED